MSPTPPAPLPPPPLNPRAGTPPTPPGPPPPPAAPSGWFPDPNGRHEHRYFNGQRWTADVADNGVRSVDPLGAGPTPGAAPLAPAPSGGGNGVATAALVCGIIGVILAWIPFVVVVGFVLAILALIFGVQGVRRAARTNTGRGRGVAGIVLGVTGLLLTVVGVIFSVVTYHEVVDFLEPVDHDAGVTACTVNSGVASVSGTITNAADSRSEFTIFVEVRPDAGRSVTVRAREIAPVGAGLTAEWSARALVDSDASGCTATVDVFGPLPFGLPMEEPPR